MANTEPAAMRVADAAGRPVEVAASDAQTLCLRWPNGPELTIPRAVLVEQDDGSLRVPFAIDSNSEGMRATLPVIQEQLHAGTHEIDTGGVRIDKHVDTHQEEREFELADEELAVERVTVNSVVPADDPPRMREEGATLVIPVLEERLVVSKQLVLKEELRVTRMRTQRTETVAETLRSEQVDAVRLTPRGGGEAPLRR